MHTTPITTALTGQQSVVRSLILAVVFFITMATHYIFKSAVVSVLIKTFSAYGMPWFDIADALLSGILVMLLLLLRARKIKISSSIRVITAVLSLSLIITSMIARPDARHRLPLTIVGLAGNVMVFIATYGIWMLMVSAAFKRSWLTLSIVGVGAQLGVWAGATISKLLPEAFITSWLPACVGVLYILIFMLLGFFMKKFSCAGTSPEILPPDTDLAAPHANTRVRQLMKGFSPYIKMLLLLILIGSVFGRSVNWLIQQQADYKSTIKEATGFLATFYQSSALISLAFQLLITPVTLRMLPNRWGLIIQPLFAMTIIVLMLLKIDTYIYVTLLMVFTSLDFTMYNAFKERLWLPVPLVNKVYHKAVAALFIPKIAGVINGLGVLILAAGSMQQWKIFVMIQAALWILVVWQVSVRNRRQEQYTISDVRPSLDAV